MAATENHPATATEYVVLEQRTLHDGNSDTPIEAWVEAGIATGTTRMGVALETAGEKEGIWRPVPTRNWARAIRTRTKTDVKTVAEEVEPF